MPQGSGDYHGKGGPWYSWNAAGSTQSPGTEGPTCTEKATSAHCYTSCGQCEKTPQCSWTTCHNQVTPDGTGYTNVNGFIPSLWDTLESQLCIDTTREYAAGQNNGGMMTYQLAAAMSSRIAAAAPVSGSFHKGFLQGPTSAVPLIDIHGSKDTIIPANTSLSGDGYYFTTVADIFKVWGKANGCSGNSFHYSTPYDGHSQLYCVNHGKCLGDLVRCAWNGGSTWFANSASKNGGLITYFLLQWTETSHVGFGNQAYGNILENIEISGTESNMQSVYETFEPTLKSTASGHYGNPSTGCLDDEEVVELAEGTACAPKIASTSDGPVPEPQCNIGGASPQENGCPTDAPVNATSKAFPLCIAKGKTNDPYMNEEFHCVLACPCEFAENYDCGAKAHAQCPTGAFCQHGELRHRSLGVCTYTRGFSAIV